MKRTQGKRFWLTDFLRSWSEYRAFRKLSPRKRNIVFYSESGQDWHHFEPLIHYLTGTLARTVSYVTSDPSDSGLELKKQNLFSFYIREGYWQILFFQFLKADVMVLTMIDLHLFQLKRSIYPVHYIYIFHAMGSTHMVDFENSYDHYDSIFCVGPHQMKEIFRREELYHLPAKRLFAHGYARVEQLRRQAEAFTKKDTSAVFVLLAPTWGEHSILHVCGLELVGILLEAGFEVILRPHYQTIRLAPQIVERILTRYGKHHSLKYVDRMGDSDSLFASDILICDWSSMSIEYALGLEKPVLYIDVPRRVRNPRYMELGIEPMEVTIRNEAGTVLSPADISKSPDVIRRLLQNPDQFKQKIASLREKIVFNFGTSVEAGAREIARIADEKAKPD